MKHKATVIFLSAESHNRDIARLERVGRTHPRMIGGKRLLLTFVVIAAQAGEDLPSSLPRGRIYGGTDAEPG